MGVWNARVGSQSKWLKSRRLPLRLSGFAPICTAIRLAQFEFMPWRFPKPPALCSLLALAILFQVSTRAWAEESEESEKSEESGVAGGGDITRPTRGFDVRFEVESGEEEKTRKLTLRYDRPIRIAARWQLNLRADVPFATATHDGDEAEHHERSSGVGDVLLHAVFAHYVLENQGVGFGTQLIIPSANDDALGKGKWRLRPTAGYRWSLPRLSEESFLQLLVRYDVSFAGDDDRANISELQFAPNLEVGLPHSAYLSFFPSSDIRYNFVTDEFFVPVNVEIGKSFNRLIVSLEVGKGVVHGDHPPYDWKVEARVGMRF